MVGALSAKDVLRRESVLLFTPQGGRYWHYHYRYGGKRKTLSVGTLPDVPVARSPHLAARQLLAAGVNPALRRRALRHVGVADSDPAPLAAIYPAKIAVVFGRSLCL